jgi:hypothetical protein
VTRRDQDRPTASKVFAGGEDLVRLYLTTGRLPMADMTPMKHLEN